MAIYYAESKCIYYDYWDVMQMMMMNWYRPGDSGVLPLISTGLRRNDVEVTNTGLWPEYWPPTNELHNCQKIEALEHLSRQSIVCLRLLSRLSQRYTYKLNKLILLFTFHHNTLKQMNNEHDDLYCINTVADRRISLQTGALGRW